VLILRKLLETDALAKAKIATSRSTTFDRPAPRPRRGLCFSGQGRVRCCLAPSLPRSRKRSAESGERLPKRGLGKLPQLGPFAQDLQFLALTPTIRNRNRPAKQVGDQRWLNQHSMNRGSTRQSVLCAVSASPECLMNRGELHRLRTGSPAHRSRPSGPGSTSSLRGDSIF
jgi:hypothetical protein